MPDISKMTSEQIEAYLAKKKQQESKEVQAAKDDVEKALKRLNDYGFSYKLTGGSDGKGTLSKDPCSYCGFKTDPPHDGRRHKFVEGFEKRPFDSKTLKELKLRKLD